MISFDEIIDTLEQFENLDNPRKLVNQLTKEQPCIQVYLMASGEDELFNQDEKEMLLFVGIVIWQLVKKNYKHLPKVSDKILDRAEAKNEHTFEILSSDSEGDFFSVVNNLVYKYPEPGLLLYIIESIFEEFEPDDPSFSEEANGLAFFYLKTVLDALLKVAK